MADILNFPLMSVLTGWPWVGSEALLGGLKSLKGIYSINKRLSKGQKWMLDQGFQRTR